jgi:hypothetical protein
MQDLWQLGLVRVGAARGVMQVWILTQAGRVLAEELDAKEG